MALQILHEFLAVGRALLGVAQAVDLQSQSGQSQGTPQSGREQDDLQVDIRTIEAEDLNADLVELPVATALRAFVAEHGTAVPESQGLIQQAVFDDGAYTARCALRTEAQGVTVTVREAVHLLLDDIGDLADGAFEQVGDLDERGPNLRIAITGKDLPGRVFDSLPGTDPFRQDVMHPANRRYRRGHRVVVMSCRSHRMGCAGCVPGHRVIRG